MDRTSKSKRAATPSRTSTTVVDAAEQGRAGGVEGGTIQRKPKSDPKETAELFEKHKRLIQKLKDELVQKKRLAEEEEQATQDEDRRRIVAARNQSHLRVLEHDTDELEEANQTMQELYKKNLELRAERKQNIQTLNSRKYRRKGVTVPESCMEWADDRVTKDGFTEDVLGSWRVPLVLQQYVIGGDEGIQAFVDLHNASNRRADMLPGDVANHSYFVCLCKKCVQNDLKNAFVVAFPASVEGSSESAAPGFARYDMVLPDKPKHAVLRHLRAVEADVTDLPVALTLREAWVVSDELQSFMDMEQKGLEACLRILDEPKKPKKGKPKEKKLPNNWWKKTYFFCQCEVCTNNDLEHAAFTSFVPAEDSGFVPGTIAGYGVRLPKVQRSLVRDHLKKAGADFSKLPVALQNE